MTAANRQRTGQEFPDDGIKRNVTVVDVNRGFGLCNATAFHAGKNPQDDEGEQQAGHRGDDHDSRRSGIDTRTQQPQPGEINRDAETYDRQSRKEADDNR